jgi:hypothetical protein
VTAARHTETAHEVETLRVEISEDMTRFAYDESKTFEDGLPRTRHFEGVLTGEGRKPPAAPDPIESRVARRSRR